MNENLLNRILRKHKRQTRSIALILCLSILVALGTFAGFHKRAVAKVYTNEVLDCPYTHEGAEPVAHTHNDDCYNGETLVCSLPEIEAHTHTDACYTERQVLICMLEENPGHQHTDACYTEREVLSCGLEENPGHQHTGTCFNADGALICTIPEGEGAHEHTPECYETVRELTCTIPEGEGAHTHTAECYETVRELICDKPELPLHVHDAGCFYTEEITVDEPEEVTESEPEQAAEPAQAAEPEQKAEPEQTTEPVQTDEPKEEEKTLPEMPVGDLNADLESASDWEHDFDGMELSGNWATDLVLVAATQQGHGESPNNFEAVLNDAGDAWVKHGYTRYGAWYGAPYAEEWSAMFVSFCLRYAGIPAEYVPNNPTAADMAESFQKGELFAGQDYVPAVGDLIFFDTEKAEGIDHMGIVYYVDEDNGTINTVEGGRSDAVETFGYHLDDKEIAGYGILPQNPNNASVEGEDEGSETGAEGGLIITTEDKNEEKKEEEEQKESEENKETAEETVSAVPMPAQSWERTAGGMKVTVEAPEGAFPENTKIAVTPVNGNSLKDTVSDAVEGEILEVQAVDITFFNAEGREIEPALPIRVVMTPAETRNAEEKANVVHVDLEQQTAEVIAQAEGTETDNSEVVFDADSFTIYAIVYTVHFEYEVNGETFTSASMPGAEYTSLAELIRGLGIVSEEEIDTFVSKISAVASTNEDVAVVENTDTGLCVRVLRDGDAQIVITMQDGAQFRVDVVADGETEVSDETNVATVSTVGELYLPAEAKLEAKALDDAQSESAIAAVQEAEESTDNSTGAETAYQVFDISLENVEADQYDGFQVVLNLPENVIGKDYHLYHIHEGFVEELELKNADGSELTGDFEQLSSVSFVTTSFSEFVLKYTVDFFYGEYSYTLEGGTSMLLSELVKALRIADDETAFLGRVENVEFSDVKLLRVTRIYVPTTVAAVEDSIFDVVFEDAEIEPRSTKELEAGEWLLTSLAPFGTEEALTITLDNGSQFVISVHDAQTVEGNSFITDAQLTIDGVTYGKNDTWQVYPDVGYAMKLSFNEKGQNQFPKGGDTIAVNIPDGLTIVENEHHTFNIPAGLAGTITGNEYWVENGKLYIKFGEDPDDILTRSSNAHFDLTFTAKFAEGTTHVPFNDKVNPKVDIDTEGSVSVSKSASYNSVTGKMDYTIVVKSTGNSENVMVSDALASTDLLKIDTSSITVSPSDTSYTTTSADEGGFNLTIPSMSHNETVTITYSANVDTSALDHKGNIKALDDGKNTVTVDNDDHHGDEDTNTYNHRIKYSSTSKSSTTVTDHEAEDANNETATVGWKIVLNDNYRGSIVGDQVTDTIDWNSKDAMKYTVDEYGKVTLHLTAKNQDGTKTYTQDVQVAVNEDGNGVQSWTYTIPKFGADENEILSYEITYTTEVDKTKLTGDANGNAIVKNNTYNEGDDSGTGTGIVPGVGPNDDPGEDKIVGGKTATAVTTEYIDWDIVVVVPDEGFPNGFTIVDDIPVYHQFRDTFDSIVKVTGLVNHETYAVETTHEHTNELDPVGKTRDVVTLTFYQDEAKTDPGLDAQARTITVTIRTRNDQDWIAFAESRGGGDPAYYHTNTAKVNNSATFTASGIPLSTKVIKNVQGSDLRYVGNVQLPHYEYYIILSNVTEVPVVITDTYNPDDLVFVGKGSATDWTGHDNIAAASQMNELNIGVEGYTAEFVDNGSGTLTITATELPKKVDGSFYEYYKIYYTMRVKDQAALDSFTQKAIENGGTYKIGNTAEWNGTEDHYDIDYNVPTLKKTGSFRVEQGQGGNDRLYDFAIDINKEKLRLNGGEPMDLTDTHTVNLTVDYTTIKVYRYDDNGVKTEDPTIEWNFNGNIGTFYNLKDETHYTIEYSCLVIGSGYQEFSNYAEMEGYHTDKQDNRDFGTDINAGATVYQIQLIKYKNGMTSQGLGGATFQLFRGTGKYDFVTEGEYTWGVEEKEAMTWGYGTETAGKVGLPITFTTDDSGYVLIALNQTDHGAELEEGVHYYLKEIESPPGYQIDSSVEFWEFTLTTDPDEVCYGTARDEYTNNRKWIYFYYDDVLKMNNTETEEPISVKVEKKWYEADGTLISDDKLASSGYQAEFQLYQNKNNQGYVAVDTITNSDGVVYQGKITLPIMKDGSRSWEYNWGNLPRVDDDGNQYAYKIEETMVQEGFVSSTEVNETESNKVYHVANHRAAATMIKLKATKEWVGEDGETKLDPNSENLPDYVDFQLFRVVSRVPFGVRPTSGGNPYIIESSLYYQSGAEQPGTYRLSKTAFDEGITLGEGDNNLLVSVEKKDGVWYYYSYYVKELPVEGYNSSLKEEATEVEEGQTYTTVIQTMKNTKKPDERTTDLSVQKVWKDKEDSNKSWPSGMTVQFKLYQVTGKTPFNTRPDSGGTLYDVKDQYGNNHPARVAEGTYELNADRTSIDFTGLPEVIIDARGRATYYAYYVEEVEVTGYETDYKYETMTEPRKVSVTITNRQEPDFTQISVEKKWYDSDGETALTGDAIKDLEATVELVRYRSEPTGTMVHSINTGKSTDEVLATLLLPRNKSNVIMNVTVGGGATWAYLTDYVAEWAGWQYQSGNANGIHESEYVNSGSDIPITLNTPDASDLWIVFCFNSVNSVTATTAETISGGEALIDPTFDSSQHQVTLNNPDFSHTYTKLLTTGKGSDDNKTYIYSYGIREVSNPSGFEFKSYSVGTNTSDSTEGIPASNAGSGTITVTNTKTEDETGALKFTKKVTVNGAEISTEATAEQKQAADGEYSFTITGPGTPGTFSNTVVIKVENGKATQYKIGNEAYNNLLQDGYVVISDLVAGDYTITETDPTNGTTLSSIIRGDVKSDGTYDVTPSPVDLDNNKVTVHVTAGDTTAAEGDAQATFTNNAQIGSLEIVKKVTYKGGTTYNDKAKAALKGTYTFTIYLDDTCQTPYQVNNETKSVTLTIDEDMQSKSTTVSNLPVGDYWIKETESDDGVYPIQNPIKVTVSAGSTSTSSVTPKAEFTNNYTDGPDDAFISVTKKFTGVKQTEVNTLQNFKITVLDSNGKSYELTKTSYGWQQTVNSNGDIIWSWKISNIPIDSTLTYTVSEEGYQIEGYNVTPSGFDQSISLSPATMTFDYHGSIATENSHTDWDVDNTIFAASLTKATDDNHKSIIFITKRSLSLSQRDAVKTYLIPILKTEDSQGNWAVPDDHIYFYSVDLHPEGFAVAGGTVTFDVDNKVVHFETTSQWKHVVYATFTVDESSEAGDIQVTNDYSEIPVDIDIIKVDKNTLDTEPKNYLKGAKFTITQLDETGSGVYKKKADSTTTEVFFTETTDPTEEDGKVTFVGLKTGYYEIKETNPPDGYVMTTEAAYIKVSGGVVQRISKTVDDTSTTDKDESKVVNWPTVDEASTEGMIRFTAAKAASGADPATNAAVTVGNEQGIELPETGGIGTTLFTALGGFLTVTAGVILTMRRGKRRTAES